MSLPRPTPTATFGGRILSANSRGLLRAVAISVIVVIAVSFAISFTALVELAIMARIPAAVAWGWPLVVDGTMVVATFGTVLLATRTSRLVRAYPWIVLGLFGALSIYANGIHSVGGQISAPEAFTVGAVAPLALLASTHLLVTMLHSPVPELTDEQIAKTLRKAAKAADAPPVAPAKSEPATKSASDDDKAAAVARILGHFDSTGEWPSGSTVAGWTGKSAKTGVRWVADARRTREPADDRPAATALDADTALRRA